MNITQIINFLAQGGLIAYPTEGVYGLGCDPFNEFAVMHLLKLKQRSIKKGLILITHDWQCVADLTKPIPADRFLAVQNSWPGPFTWIFPASKKVPAWIRGAHDTIALRVTAHPVARKICAAYGKPIVSTSANLSDEKMARTAAEVKKYFSPEEILLIEGEVGSLVRPTQIADAMTGKILR